MTTPDKARLAELKARATPGPWEAGRNKARFTVRASEQRPKPGGPTGMVAVMSISPLSSRALEGVANATLIVAAVNALPHLLAEIAALRAALEPFAGAASRVRADDPDNDRPALAKAADYRAARLALKDAPDAE